MRSSTSVDRISNLSDDTLCLILSYLSTRDAVRTDILSKRWRNLWTYTGSIKLDMDEILGMSHASHYRLLHEPFVVERMDEFVRLVDQFFVHNLGHDIKSFSLHLCSSKYYDRMERWIYLAMKMHVEKLDINVNGATLNYYFPHHLFTEKRGFSLKCLSLSHCYVCPTDDINGFTSLTFLSLENVTFSQNLLSCCHLLEELNLQNCHGLDQLNIGCPPFHLKYLKVFGSGDRLEVYAKNLISFECSGFNEAFLHLSDDKNNDCHLSSYGQFLEFEPSQGRHIFAPNAHLGGFRFLKVLALRYFNFTTVLLENLLSNCPLVEHLNLEDCIMSLCTTGLEIHGLIHLNCLIVCRCQGFLETRVCAKNLRKFVFISDKSNLNVRPNTFKHLGDDGNEFPSVSGAGSRLKDLHLHGCSLPVDLSNFSFLVTVSLENMCLGQECVKDILSNCLLLERLSIKKCSFLVTLEVTGTSIKLKHLLVSWCQHLEEITISANDLTSFVYHGHLLCFSFKEVPKLVRVEMDIARNCSKNCMAHALPAISHGAQQLQTLFFNIWDEEIPGSLPTFSCLKHLALFNCQQSLVMSDPSWAISLLMASPFLEVFQLQLPGNSIDDTIEATWPLTFTHHHLKEAELCGFRGSRRDIELAVSLLHNAKALKLMKVDPLRFRGDNNEWHSSERSLEWIRHQRKQTLQQLKKEAPPGVEVVIH